MRHCTFGWAMTFGASITAAAPAATRPLAVAMNLRRPVIGRPPDLATNGWCLHSETSAQYGPARRRSRHNRMVSAAAGEGGRHLTNRRDDFVEPLSITDTP